MKARYEASKSDIEKAMYRYYDDVADGLVRQAAAVCLYALHLHGWGPVRLQRMFDWLLEVLDMPPVFGEQARCEDCMAYLTERYGIDFDKLSVQKETFAEFRRR